MSRQWRCPLCGFMMVEGDEDFITCCNCNLQVPLFWYEILILKFKDATYETERSD